MLRISPWNPALVAAVVLFLVMFASGCTPLIGSKRVDDGESDLETEDERERLEDVRARVEAHNRRIREKAKA